MKKLEKELEMQKRKHVSAIKSTDTGADHSESALMAEVDVNKNKPCSRVHRPCRRAPGKISSEITI